MLAQSNPALADDYKGAKHAAEAQSKFVRYSGRFFLTAVGKVNTYSLFAETDTRVLTDYGRAGLVVPTGIATDDTTKAFFGNLVAEHKLHSLYGYENEGNIFVGVHHAFKFALLTAGGVRTFMPTEITFLCRRIEDIRNPIRRFRLSADDFALLNPNTRTCPVFRTRADAEITKKLSQNGLRKLIWNTVEGNP